MFRVLIPCVALSLWLVAAPQARKATSSTSLTGILDEQANAQYVLREENELKLLVVLKPVGFANENFAKYVGQKVTVSGRVDQTASPPVMQVERIRKVPDS